MMNSQVSIPPVSLHDGMHHNGRRTAYVALGSNVGDRLANIEQACRLMEKRGIRVTRTSSLWETEPMYVLDQEKFVNGACEVSTLSHWSGGRANGG